MLTKLMQLYQSGDAGGANQLVERLQPILARYFYANASDPSQVEDLLQDCWLRIHGARHSYRPGEPVLPWVFAIARHARVDQHRRLRRTSGREFSIDRAGAALPFLDPHPRLDGSIEARRILAIVEDLPVAQKEVLVMLKIVGMSIEEVAIATGSTSNAVKQKAFRAYRTIRKRLGSP